MLCQQCQMRMRKFGHNRNGSQRYFCNTCQTSLTDEATRQVDHRRLPHHKLIMCLSMLLEDVSIRAVERLTRVARSTIIRELVIAGEACKSYPEVVVRRLTVEEVQADEIWAFVGCKEKTRQRNNYHESLGDAYCFTAVERSTKMFIAWHLGKRTPEDTLAFAKKLRDATNGRFQLSTDGYRPYLTAIPSVFGSLVDFATVVKVYGNSEDDHRFSPGTVVDTIKTPQAGAPDPNRICTSHVERSNKTLRMQNRRFTRLTDAHSKKWENHEAALALFFANFNFCRVHSTIKTTPAVKAGLTTEPWKLEWLLDEAIAIKQGV